MCVQVTHHPSFELNLLLLALLLLPPMPTPSSLLPVLHTPLLLLPLFARMSPPLIITLCA
jgi:hypothetical protein